MVSNIFLIVMGFIRTTLLARWLPVEVFGIYGMAHSWVTLSAVLPNFGMGNAFVHRSPETEDEERAAQVHFTLQLIFSTAWAILMIVGALLFTATDLQVALILLTVTSLGMQIAHTPRLILARRVVHRRLALIDFMDTTLSTLVTLFLALRGATLWALLSNNIVTLSINLVLLYIWRPVWRPKVTWDRAGIRYFLWFGVRNVIADGLLRALDKVDDLWTGIFLGDVALGYYSRAYTFAIYPRKILASPINMVTKGTYAELKGDRKRLSQAFFRINALLVWAGFLLAGGLSLVAPEFIHIVLGEKWLPMLTAFQLMLIYTLFDPIKITIAALFIAVGEPGKIVQIRSIQLIVLMIGLITLGSAFGITGVALAVDLMLVVGIILFLWRARTYVDFSFRKLFSSPAISLLISFALTKVAINAISVSEDWLVGILKITVFFLTYTSILLILEYKEARKLYLFALQYYNRSKTLNSITKNRKTM